MSFAPGADDILLRAGGERRGVTVAAPLQGELQVQIMHALWRIEQGTVDEVRSALPSRYRGAYTTVQTVLNRLAERGLLKRSKRGNAIVYAPRISEMEYLTDSIDNTLVGASRDARRAALAQLVGQMDPDEISELQALAREIERRRSRRR